MVHLPARERGFSLLQNFSTGCGTYPTFYSTGRGVVCMGVKRPEREANHSPHLALRLRMNGTVSPVPPVAFVARTGTTLLVSSPLYFGMQSIPCVPTALIAPSFTFTLHTRLPRFFQT